jgi:superfamily II DNA/RNA helicase
MVKFYPDIERGTSATLTNKKHIPSYIFKSATKLEKMQEDIEKVLKNTNFTNASKNTEKAIKLIEDWVPRVETFRTRVNMLYNALEAEQKDNKALREAYKEDHRYHPVLRRSCCPISCVCNPRPVDCYR